MLSGVLRARSRSSGGSLWAFVKPLLDIDTTCSEKTLVAYSEESGNGRWFVSCGGPNIGEQCAAGVIVGPVHATSLEKHSKKPSFESGQGFTAVSETQRRVERQDNDNAAGRSLEGLGRHEGTYEVSPGSPKVSKGISGVSE